MSMYQLLKLYRDARLRQVDAEGFLLAGTGSSSLRKIGWEGNEVAVPGEDRDKEKDRDGNNEGRVEVFGRLSLTIRGGRILASDRDTGKRLWTHDISDSGWYADTRRLYKGQVSERLFLFRDRLIFTSGSHVFAIDHTDGREQWHIRMPLNEALVTLDPEGLLFIKSGYYIYLVDLEDGSQLPLLDLEAASLPLTQWLSYGAVSGRDFAMVDTERKTLVILDKNDLSLQQELPLPGSEAIDTGVRPVFFGPNLFLDDGKGLVYWFVNR